MDLTHFPRVRLAHLPTPLEPLPRLCKALGGPEIWIKRDDCTGLSTGGNKTRQLEFLVGQALAQDADTLITAGAVQSNHARQTAAARHGLKCHLVLENPNGFTDDRYLNNGNLLMDQLHGATIERLAKGLDAAQELPRAIERLIADRAAQESDIFLITVGGSNATGALDYVNCAFELQSQINELGLPFNYLIHATGSAGTQAGLVAGFQLIGSNLPVLGICVSKTRDQQEALVRDLTDQTLALFNKAGNNLNQYVVASGDHVGQAYGIPTKAALDAIRTVAELESILLDPVYSGKCMAGLMELISQGKYTQEQRIVVLHTGGSAALFAYQDAFV